MQRERIDEHQVYRKILMAGWKAGNDGKDEARVERDRCEEEDKER